MSQAGLWAEETIARFQLYGPGPRGPVRWRMLAGNNRDLARGTVEFADVDACLRGIHALRRGLGRLVLETCHSGRSWRWFGSLDGEVAVAAARPFGRRIQCERMYERFAVLVVVAVVPAELSVVPARPAGAPGPRWSAEAAMAPQLLPAWTGTYVPRLSGQADARATGGMPIV
jgi:hypothetical protein